MKKTLVSGLIAIAVLTSMNNIAQEVNASTATVVSETGVLRNGQDHFFEVDVQSEPLKRLRVECVTFHELDSLEIYIDGVQVKPQENFGFEEFILTFEEPIVSGKTIRVVMLNSRVPGRFLKSISVPYRIYAIYSSFNDSEFPLGTAIVRSPKKRS